MQALPAATPHSQRPPGISLTPQTADGSAGMQVYFHPPTTPGPVEPEAGLWSVSSQSGVWSLLGKKTCPQEQRSSSGLLTRPAVAESLSGS